MILSARKELLSPPTASCHASCIAPVNGELWLTWFGGTQEGNSDVRIYIARKAADGWTAPQQIPSCDNLPHWNPVLLPRSDGADLFFKVGATIPAWRTMRVHLNADMQPTSLPAELKPGDTGGRGPVRSKCLYLSDGRLIAPASIETSEPARWKDAACACDIFALPRRDPPLRWKSFADISHDGGETFTEAAPVPLLCADGHDTPALPGEPCRVARLGAIQPTLWQSRDGHVHMLLRSSEGCILRSDSPDGRTWSPARMTDLPNNNSGIDLIQLDDGRLLLCLNPVSGNWSARTPLWLYLSEDSGDSFSPLLELETGEGEYSYPSLACIDSTVYLSYTWRREKIAIWDISLLPVH